MTIYHMHHIVPRHIGGTDDPSNLVRLTVEEHAEAHRVLYEQHGRWQDKVAWLGLSGMIGKEEIIAMACVKKGPMNGMYGKPSARRGVTLTEETKQKMRDAATGKTHTDEVKAKMSEYSKNRSDEHLENISKAILTQNKEKISCPHCTKSVDVRNYGRWHGDNCKHKP